MHVCNGFILKTSILQWFSMIYFDKPYFYAGFQWFYKTSIGFVYVFNGFIHKALISCMCSMVLHRKTLKTTVKLMFCGLLSISTWFLLDSWFHGRTVMKTYETNMKNI